MKLFLSGYIWFMVFVGSGSFYFFVTEGYNFLLLLNGIVCFTMVGFLARIWKEIFYDG